MGAGWENDRLKRIPIDLLTILLFYAITLVLVLAMDGYNPIKLIFMAGSILFAPGYLLVCMIWPERSSANKIGVTLLERFALSFGFSIMTIIVIGFLLGYLWVLSSLSMVISIGAFLFVTIIFYWSIRKKIPIDERYSIELEMLLRQLPHQKEQKVLWMSIIISLSLVLSTLIFIVSLSPPPQKFSEFYLLNQNRTIESSGYPTNLSIGEDATVYIGITNHEYDTVNYSIIFVCDQNITIEDDLDTNMTSMTETGTVIWRNITLAHGKKFEDSFRFKVDYHGRYLLSWILYKEMEPTGQALHLWVTVV